MELTARQELQVELKKLEGDYEHKLQDLSQEKEQQTCLRLEKDKENQGLQQQLRRLQQQVHIAFKCQSNEKLLDFGFFCTGKGV